MLEESKLPDLGPICLTSRGRPWTAGGFHASWRKLRLKLEAAGRVEAGLTPKGLRHTVATILAETEGIDTDDIAAVLGHETHQMARHYSRRADRARRVAGAVAKFDAESNRRRTEVVKPV
jgi:integrase